MKINPLDAHDRLLDFSKKDFDISECVQDLVNKRPFGNHAFYIFVHPRTDDDGVKKRLIWQPRLTKPQAQTNSMLFKAYPGSDLIKVIWMIPDRTTWAQYQKGKLTQNETVFQSIEDFLHNRDKLEQREIDDLPDDEIARVYTEISMDANFRKI